LSKLTAAAEFAKIVEASAATIALIAGAVWFSEQHESYPRADLQQSVEVVPVQPDLVSVEVHTNFENTGKKPIHLSSAFVMLQNVAASPFGLRRLARLKGAAYWEALRPVKTPDPHQFHEGELRWPVLNEYDGPIDHDVEPGETDVLVFTFLLACRQDVGSAPLNWVRVASEIEKPNNAEEKGFAWNARTFADLSSACGAHNG